MATCPFYKERIIKHESKILGMGRQPRKPIIDRVGYCNKKGVTWTPTIGQSSIPCGGDPVKCIV